MCVYVYLRRTYSVICLEIVNVLAKDERPQVFAEEFDYVEGIVEAGSIARESVMRPKKFGSCLATISVVWERDVICMLSFRGKCTFLQDPDRHDNPAPQVYNAPHRDVPRRLSSWEYLPLLHRPRLCQM